MAAASTSRREEDRRAAAAPPSAAAAGATTAGPAAAWLLPTSHLVQQDASSSSSKPGSHGSMEERRRSTLRSRISIRNHVSGPGGGDEPQVTMSSGKEGLLGFASGLVAGVVGVVTGYPFDVLKYVRGVSGALIDLVDSEGGWGI